ncbi:MAG: hypothetical protein H6626_10040 [Pseudobdellovibrionaceae bacterium]|nr:hypothetical protein [Bdellovibrionales bacterium]USN46553.1 MAG: hypothetical protein H6626_10040 [Pseudobdellovibrionaceae bacterium]
MKFLVYPFVLTAISTLILSSSAFATPGGPDYLCYSDQEYKFLFSVYTADEAGNESYLTTNLGGRTYDRRLDGQFEWGKDARLNDATHLARFVIVAKFNSEKQLWDAQVHYPDVQKKYDVKSSAIEMICQKYSDELYDKLLDEGY